MNQMKVDIETPDGRMGTFVCHPETAGPFPVVLFFMDAPGIREELRDMARRLAAAGYYVMLPNLYYRHGVEELADLPQLEPLAARERMFGLMNGINIDLVVSDAARLLAFAAGDGAGDTTRVGTLGYCMSGQYALSCAARFPDQVRAAASIYGTRLVTEAPDSPHRTAPHVRARLHVACAEEDSWAPPETIAALRAALEAGGADATVEVYPGTQHGFAFPQRAVYDEVQAERHWAALFDLFAETLQDAGVDHGG